MRKLLIFIAIVFAAFVIWAVVGSLLTGNKPESDKGIGAVNRNDSTMKVADDTLKR